MQGIKNIKTRIIIQLQTKHLKINRGDLTELRGLANSKSVGPKLGDGCIVETIVTHGLFETALCDNVQHVFSGPDRSDNTEL